MENKKKKYTVRLRVPTTMWALVEVEAMSAEEALSKALQENEEGGVFFEFSGFDARDAESGGVDESE